MTMIPRGGRSSTLRLLIGLVLAVTTAATAGARLDTWRDDSTSAFRRAQRDRVVVSDGNKVRLGHALAPLGKFEATRVWDLARGPGGELYAATGDDGKVYRRPAADGAAWSLAYDAPDTQALALAVTPEGHLFVGTGPSGQVIDVTDPKHPVSRPSKDVLYIWDLATDPKGNLYAATGPTGQLWKRSPDGHWSLLLDSKHSHLLCVAVGADGSVFAGSDGEGLVYKVAPGGKVSVVYDAPQSEVRCLLAGPGGCLYAGTASDSGSGSSRGPINFSRGSTTGEGGDAGSRSGETAATAAQTPPPKPDPTRKDDERPRATSPSQGGSATPRPVSPGDNAVYRIEPDGAVREVFRAKVLVFALALHHDHLLVGTGPEGQLFEVNEQGQESAPLARLDTGHILSLVSDPGGGVVLGTADPGSVVRLEPGFLPSGTLVSEVKDTKLISRFGAITWRAHNPAGTSVGLQVRTGNVAEPDSTWSDWSPEQTDPATARAHVPAGRFAQYRATLATTDPATTPELLAVTLRYQTVNLAPEIAKLDVPDVSQLDGTTRQTRLTIKWDVSDPNDDEMSYTLHLRKEGWPDWVRLNDQPLTEKSYAWDTTSVPAGHYRVRVVASDRPSNNPADALQAERISEPFVIDHEAPAVTIKAVPGRALVVLHDRLTRIVKASYAVDGGEWVPVFADNGLFDTPDETLTIDLSPLKPGAHVLMVRASDAAGNVGSGDTLIEVK
jgi:hypothetical protein